VRFVLAAKSSATSTNLAPTGERLINCHAAPAPEGSIAPLILKAAPPLRFKATLAGPFFRAMARVQEVLYAVCAGGLYRVAEDGSATRLASVPDDPNTAISGARDKVTITAGGAYFVWNGTSLTQPGGGVLTNIGSVAFLDQYTLLSEKAGRRLEWTAVADPLTRNGLYFATAEARDDRIIRLVTSGASLGVLKEHSVETWGLSGVGGSGAFVRIGSQVSDKGIAGFNLVTNTPSGPFYIGEDRIAYLAGAPVSPPAMNEALAEGDPTHCFYYEQEGHQYAVTRFSDRPAWVYDIAMGMPHERSHGTSHKPWDVIAACECYGRWHLADRLGRVYTLGEAPFDADTPMRRTIVSRPLFQDNEPFTIAKLALFGLFGNYSIAETAPGWLTDANGFPVLDHLGRYILGNEQHPVEQTQRQSRIWIRVSDDGGYTWSEPIVEDIGFKGDRNAKAEFWSLGQFDSLTVEINLTDPMDVPLMSEAAVDLA